MLGVWHALFILSLPLADLLLFRTLLVGAGQPSTFLGLGLFLALVLQRPHASWRVLARDRHSRLFLAVLAVCAISVFMSAAAPLSSWKGEVLWLKSVKQCLQLGIGFCCFAVPLLYLNSPRRLHAAIRLYAWTLAFVAGYGVLELLHYLDFDTLLFPYLARAIHYGSYFGPADTPNLVYVPSLQGFPRLRLFASEPSMAGNYLLSVTPLAVLMLLRSGGHGWRVTALAGVAALALTFSLGAWIAAMAAAPLGCTLLWRDRRRAPKVLALAVVGAAALAGLSLFLDRKSGALSVPAEVLGRLTRDGGADISVSGRLLENRTAWEIFADYPVLGVGIGNWVFHYPGRMNEIPNTYVYFREQVTESGFERAAGINNLFLRLLCETGIVGTVVFVLFLASIWRTAARVARTCAPLRATAVGLAVACAGLTLHFNSLSAFDKRYWWFVFGLIAAAGRLASSPAPVYVLAPAPTRAGRQEDLQEAVL
jgi:O-antigen ligase